MHRVEEVEVQLGLDVVAALRADRPARATAAAASAEQVAEEIAEPAGVADVFEADVAETGAAAREATAEPAEAAGSGARRDHLAHLVVLLALLGVAEHVVRGGDLLEALLGVLVPRVGVGVELLRELPVGARDLLVGRARRHAEHLVVVLLEPLPLRSHRSTPRASRGPSTGAGPGR